MCGCLQLCGGWMKGLGSGLLRMRWQKSIINSFATTTKNPYPIVSRRETNLTHNNNPMRSLFLCQRTVTFGLLHVCCTYTHLNHPHATNTHIQPPPLHPTPPTHTRILQQWKIEMHWRSDPTACAGNKTHVIQGFDMQKGEHRLIPHYNTTLCHNHTHTHVEIRIRTQCTRIYRALSQQICACRHKNEAKHYGWNEKCAMFWVCTGRKM